MDAAIARMARGREWMGQCVGAERGLLVRAMFARFRMGRWFAGERGRGPRVVALRRASQVFFLLLFLFLLLRTEFRGTVGAGGDVRLHWPVRLFFEIDPLAALANALATHALYRGLLWSLIILLPAMFLGRFFCGWICPMGTLHHFFGNLRSESKRGKQGIEANRYKGWQRTKYVILIAVLAAAVCGTGLVGWFDPFSLLVRSMGLSILPGANYAANAGLNAMGHSGVGFVQLVGMGLHAALAATILNFKQPHFRQGDLSGADLFNSAGSEPAGDSLLVPRALPAGRAAGRGVAVVGLRVAQGRGELRQVQSLPAALPGRRRSGGRGAVAQGRVPDVHELPGRLSAPEFGVPLLPQGGGGCRAEPAAAQGADRAGGGDCGGAAAAGQYGDGKEPRRAADPSAGGAG